MAVANLCLLRDLSVSLETEQQDDERMGTEERNRREISGDERSWMDTNDTEEDKNFGVDIGRVEEPQASGQQNEKSDHENVAHFSPRGDDDSDSHNDNLAFSSSNSDDNNSNDTFLAGHEIDSGITDEQNDDNDGNRTEPCSKLSLEVFVRSSEEEEDGDTSSEEYEDGDTSSGEYEDGDTSSGEYEDGDTSSEEYEEYQDKLYCHSAYPKKVFQALEEMKHCSFLTDLSVCTNSGFCLRAHSLVVAAVSTLVQQMVQERDEEEGSEMCLHLGAEVSELGLSAVLEFAYTGTIRGLNKESLPQIQTAAFILGVPRVLELCKKEEEGERKRDKEEKIEEKLSAEEQMKDSLDSIWQLWEERVGCDMELEAEGRVFRAHKILLMASSDYFHAMFTSGMKESQQASVTLLMIRAAELQIFLGCLYSGALTLDWGCVFELTCAALQFQFQPALSLCLSFMQQEMDAASCLDVASFAEAYGMSDLQGLAEDFALRHFEDVAATLKFQDLPVEKLKTYLHSKALYVASELPVFKAVVCWIGANPRRRLKEAKDLLAAVQFSLMTFKEFKEVKAITSWPQVSTEDIYDSLLGEFCSSTFNVLSDFRTYLPKEALVLVGGERVTENLDKRKPCKEIWFSNSFRNHVGVIKRVEWRMLAELPEKPRFSHSVAVIQGKLYVVGGRHYYGQLDTMKCAYRYDPLENIWQRLADMSERRGSFALVVVEGKIYAIGGDRDSEANVESVEVYCPNTDSWSFAHPLDQSLSGHAASVWNGKIFISGGFDCRYHCLVSMLSYHPEKGTTYLEDMYQSRAQHCMETFKDHLYIAGGVSDAGGQLADELFCEFYDPVNDFWGTIKPLIVPHVSAASAVLEGKIYVIGGYCQEDYSDQKQVHRYDPLIQCWENMCGTPSPTTYIAACVLPIPSQLRQL